MNLSVPNISPQPQTVKPDFHHPNPARFAEICQRFFPYLEYAYNTVRREVPMPALLSYAGYPVAANQFCFHHRGTGTSLSVFMHRDGFWFFHCCSCGIQGDVVEMWYLLVLLSGLEPAGWDRPRAAGDLLARAEAGMIDVSMDCISSRSAGRPARPTDIWQKRLRELIEDNKRSGGVLPYGAALPKPVRMSVQEAIVGLFPHDGFMMLTNKKNFHPIMRRDVWLSGCYHGKPSVESCSFVSSNYCRRDDADGTSYEAFEGIKRRWMIIEGDAGTLKQQLWIHKRLAKRYGNLGCVCFSGGKSLHGWYQVEGWTAKQRFNLFAEAVSLGINDNNTWKICQQVRLPGGVNQHTSRKQLIYLWNC